MRRMRACSANLQMVLEPDQVIAAGPEVLLAQLNHSVGPAAGARIGQPHRFHGTEAQRIAAAARQLLERQTGLEERRVVFGDVRGHGCAASSASTKASY